MTSISSTPSRQDHRVENNGNRPSKDEPPRKKAERDTLADRFASRLLKEHDGKSSAPRHASRAGAEPAGRQPRDYDQSDRQGSDMGDGAKADIARQLSSEAAGKAQAASQASQADRSIIDRMAAQIAEGRGIGAAVRAEISFPPGALAQSALIQRMPDGGMAIRIVGVDTRLGPVREARAKLGLMAALENREVRVASLTFERPNAGPGQRPGRDSTMSRVV